MAKAKPKARQSLRAGSRLHAFLAVLLGPVGFLVTLVLSLIGYKNSYAMFYAKQALVLVITWLIPPVGLVLTVWTLVNSVSGKQKNTPLVGWIASKINV